MIKPYLYLSILFSVLALNAGAQIGENAIPWSYSENIAKISSFVKMQSFDRAAFIRESIQSQMDHNKTYMFAKELDTLLNPENSGEWQEITKGRIWRVGIYSAGAYSLYLTFQAFHLSNGVRLFIYAPGYRELRGAYTSRNNNPGNIFSIAPMAGDSLIVELDVPRETENYGEMNITRVYHDCRNEFGRLATTGYKSLQSGTCMQDINCENGKYWQTEKRAVCKIVIDNELCSGALIGNTSGSQTPYVLTANHCISDSTHAAIATFTFNVEYLSCGSDALNGGQTVFGSTLIASTGNKLDFALLKLNRVPPVSAHPYYAGWDNSGDIPQSGVCIHQPWGLGKQIAIEYHPLITSSVGLDYDTLSDWEVSHWEVGTTQPGSSGAPLFNKHHLLVGNLTGGRAECDDPRFDYFSKFSLSWDKYTEPHDQLKPWLDPLNKGLSHIDGYDPYGFNVGICDTAWNIPDYEKLHLSKAGLDWGWISGHNSAGFTQFAEKFISNTSIQIPGIFLQVAKAHAGGTLSHITVKIWEGNTLSEMEKYDKIVFIKDLKPDAVNYVPLDSVVTVTGNFFIGYAINYNNPADSFAVYHTTEPVSSGVSTMYIYNGKWQNVNTMASLHQSASLGIGLSECYGSIQKPDNTKVNVYPNPCSDYLYVDMPTGTTIYGIDCYDITGKQLPGKFEFSEEKNKLQFQLPDGIYILRITTGEKVYITRFIVSKHI